MMMRHGKGHGQGWTRSHGGMLAMALLLAGVPGPVLAGAGQGSLDSAGGLRAVSAADQGQADALLARLMAAIAANPGASMAQVQGQIMLAISQAQVNCTVSQMALSRLQEAVVRRAPSVRAAVARASTLARSCSGGTIAGIAPGNGDLGLLQQGTTLGLASGGSNYLTAP